VRQKIQENKLSNMAPIAITIGSLFALTPSKSLAINRQFVGQDDQTPVHKAVRAALFIVIIVFLGGYISSQVSEKRDCGSSSRAIIDFAKEPSNVSRFMTYRECGKIHFYPNKTLFDVMRKTETVFKTANDSFLKIRDLFSRFF
jgi:hypothetical protein